MDLLPKEDVHILTYGDAKVAAVLPDDGGYMVQRPGLAPMHFTVGGCLGASSKRLLYYRDPIVVEPPRDKILWEAFKGMSRELFDALSRWRAGGWRPHEGSD